MSYSSPSHSDSHVLGPGRPPRFAVVTTYNRPAELARLVSSLDEQCDHLLVIDNASDVRPTVTWHVADRARVLVDESRPPNLYVMWNVGLRVAAALAEVEGHGEWDVALFNDDADVPAGWYDRVAAGLRGEYGPVAACSTDAYGHLTYPALRRAPDRNPVTKMCPWAFVTRGELGVRADENFGWWYGDNDFEFQLTLAGGVLVLPGDVVANTCANSTTVGALAEQAGRDAEYFRRKWG